MYIHVYCINTEITALKSHVEKKSTKKRNQKPTNQASSLMALWPPKWQPPFLFPFLWPTSSCLWLVGPSIGISDQVYLAHQANRSVLVKWWTWGKELVMLYSFFPNLHQLNQKISALLVLLGYTHSGFGVDSWFLIADSEEKKSVAVVQLFRFEIQKK